jgi:hypothetical protein
VTLFTIAKLWKQPRCSTTNEWIKKIWNLYTMEFYSATKKNEIFLFALKGMELENITLSEVRLRRSKATCSLSDVDNGPKTNAAVLWNMGHTKGRLCIGGKETKTLNVLSAQQ